MRPAVLTTLLIALLGAAGAPPAAAQDRLCDTRYEDCRAPLLSLINNEPPGGGIDVAFWFITDARYSTALINAKNRGVRVRVLMDSRANETKAGNSTILGLLRDGGIPMREKVARSWSDILHWKMMLFASQNVVEFSAANFTPDSFVPNTPYRDYIDEAVYFTNDSRLTNTFRTRFEDYWTDTSGNFRDYANVSGTQVRHYPIFTQDPALNFPPTQDYAIRIGGRYNAEIALGAGRGAIDVIMYRMSDARHADAMIRAVQAGVPVRLITEEENYRDGRYIWHSYNADRQWAGGVQVKDHVGGKQGINHQKSVILHGLREVIFGTSNWSSASSNQQLEHNLFSRPCAAGQVTWCDGGGPNNKPAGWFYNWFVKQFNDKWNSVNPIGFEEFKPFRPLPGGTPVNSLPANGATGVATTGITFRWDGGNWNHKYDVYLGTTPTLTAADKVASDIIVGSPYTGQWETWTTPSSITLTPGSTYYWRVVGKTMADGPRAAAAGLNLAKPGPTWSFTTAGSPPPGGGGGLSPFTGTRIALPGTIQVENFDNGGAGVAYRDTTSGNNGAVYRSTDVDIGPASDSGGGYYVGWTAPGEWLKYSVDIASTGTYTLEARVANKGTGARFRVLVDGADVTGLINLPDTGDWQGWQTITKTGVQLTAGARVVTVSLENGTSQNGGVGNFNYLRFTAGSASTGPTPFGGTPVSLPGTIQAENFDEGGSSVAYNDTTPGNNGGAYRSTDVDIGPASDTGGGFYVGWTRPTEWLQYTVNVSSTGTYTLDIRVANVGTGATFRVEVGGVDKTGPITVPDTGGWQSWRTISVGITLSQGQQQKVRLVLLTGTSQNGGVGNYNHLQFR